MYMLKTTFGIVQSGMQIDEPRFRGPFKDFSAFLEHLKIWIRLLVGLFVYSQSPQFSDLF